MSDRPKFQVGGTLDPEASVYVRRPEDLEFLSAAKAAKSWINIYGCRTMGKSSLYAKHLKELSACDIEPIVIDIAAEVGDASSAVEWFRKLSDAWTVRLRLDLKAAMEALSGLRPGAAAGVVAERLLVRALLTRTSRRVLLILDEYDAIAKHSYCDDILFALRHVQAVQARTHALDSLSVCFVGLHPIHHLGRPGAANRVPYCGTFIEMRDFEPTQQTIRALAQGLPERLRNRHSVIREVLSQSGGQPLITNDLLARVVKGRVQTATAVRTMSRRAVAKSGLGRDLQLFETIEQTVGALEGSAFAALSAYKSLLDGSREAHAAEGASMLLTSGLLRRTGSRLEPKGELFRRRFDDAWAERMLSRAAGSSKMQQYRGGTAPSRKRICVVNAGGTLGMLQRGDTVVAPENAAEFRAFFPALDSIASHVEFINLQPTDSINVFPDHWITIARYIYKRRHHGFDGFVVAHGTDTMAYTASAVAFALGPHLQFPVVFTGAQTTPDVAYGDAHVNLYRACEVAKKNIPEVVISFGNFVYRAVRAQKKDDRRFDGFESPTYPPLAEITGEINVRTELIRNIEPYRGKDIRLRADFERSILIVPQFPGLEPEFFESLLEPGDQPQCTGAIVQTLGAGNVTSDEPYSFIPFVERAYSKGIPVIVTSQYPPDPGSHTKYTPAQAPIVAGAIHAGNMTLAAAVTKFRWVLAQVRRLKQWPQMSPRDKRALVSRRMVEQSVIGEF
jgi:L-asparaginase/Glu-tRNA(Gln) amidotransferase subunit D